MRLYKIQVLYYHNFKHIWESEILIARLWRGRLIHILAIENQMYVDYRMVLRNMLAESLGYHKQWKQKKKAHECKRDFPVGTDELEEELPEIERIIEAQKEAGSYEVEQICAVLAKTSAENICEITFP